MNPYRQSLLVTIYSLRLFSDFHNPCLTFSACLELRILQVVETVNFIFVDFVVLAVVVSFSLVFSCLFHHIESWKCLCLCHTEVSLELGSQSWTSSILGLSPAWILSSLIPWLLQLLCLFCWQLLSLKLRLNCPFWFNSWNSSLMWPENGDCLHFDCRGELLDTCWSSLPF